MSKRSFRATKAEKPAYPRLVDLQPGSLRRWGLAAVGGLLIGNAACTRTAGAPTAKPMENKAEKASQSTASEPPHGGIVAVQRIRVDAGTPDTHPAQVVKAEPSKPAVNAPTDRRPRERPPLAGKIRPQRLQKNPFE